MNLIEKSVDALFLNPMELISQDWMLITAGNSEDNYNTMTASWGQMGSLWGIGGGRPVTTIYVRPQRYTSEFLDREDYWTLSFFNEEYKKDLAYLGSHSGRNEDKVAKTGLTPVFADGTTYFSEAKLVLICKKLYKAPIVEDGFIDKAILNECYPNRDFSNMYVGEIVKVLVRE